MTQVEELIAWFQDRPNGATLGEILRSGQRWTHKFSARQSDARKKGFNVELIENHTEAPSLNRYRLRVTNPVRFNFEQNGQMVIFL